MYTALRGRYILQIVGIDNADMVYSYCCPLWIKSWPFIHDFLGQMKILLGILKGPLPLFL